MELNQISNFNKNRGFTMIELVIALFVLTVAVIGVYSAFSIMVVTTAQMSDKFTAAYLAQEGIEVIRNIRDHSWLQGLPWSNGLINGFPDCAIGCEVDWTTGTGIPGETGFKPWAGGVTAGGDKLNIDHYNFYSYDPTGEETRFKRKITIEPMNFIEGEPSTLKVSVTVFWEEKRNIVNIDFLAQQGSITAEDYLYNWY